MTITAPRLDDVLGLFPPGTRVDVDGSLVIGGCRVEDLAAAFGTPAYVIDEDALRAQAARFRDGLAARWARSLVAFASKAFPCSAAYRLIAEEGLGADVAGGGELVMALAAGVDPTSIVMHGNAKTDEELALAMHEGVGLVVVDNLDDIDRIEHLATRRQPVLVRITPDVVVSTHEAMATGHADSKFGFPLSQASEVFRRIRGSRRLRLDGLHVHIGSGIQELEPFAAAVEVLGALGEFPVYDLGGGLGARYTYSEHPPSVEDYLDVVVDAARTHLPADCTVILEPGRALVAAAGVTLYRVVTVKRGRHTFVAVDGGMADNLEVSLYGQRFEAVVATRVTGGGPCELVGRHCESGDRLASDVVLADPRVGDLVAVPMTGAYCYTMANNYNGARRPPVVFCRHGAPRLAVRRETYDDLVRRDLPWQ